MGSMSERLRSTSSLLRAERERQGLSGKELAFFAGCTPMAISRLERGLGGSAALKASVARVLRVPVEELWPRRRSEEVGD